jgi:glutaredoxin 3
MSTPPFRRSACRNKHDKLSSVAAKVYPPPRVSAAPGLAAHPLIRPRHRQSQARIRMQGVSKTTLYIKQGCPYCAAAIDCLRQHNVELETIDVRGNPEEMKKLEEISGNTKTPTLLWDGDVLADFGVDQLERFLDRKGVTTF